MEKLGEALVLMALSSWPFAAAGAIAAVIVRAVGAQRLAGWLRLDLGEDR